MSDTGAVRAVTFNRLGEVMSDIDGVDVHRLPPSTTLLIQTTNSLYRVVITQGPAVYVQGGAFFPEATPAYLDGASIGGSSVKVGWIGIGFLVEFRRGRRRIITSPVRGITTLNTPGAPPFRSVSAADVLDHVPDRLRRGVDHVGGAG